MQCVRRTAGFCLSLLCFPWISSCSLTTCDNTSFGATTAVGTISYAVETTDPLATYSLQGNNSPVLDPSIMRQGSTYYAFSTDADATSSNFLAIRCSQDLIDWSLCSSVFPTAIPSWVAQKIPGITGLWAPDISFFNGLYHVYYAGSTLGSIQSVIGLATNKTLDPKDPSYQWVDQGEVLESNIGDNFNAIDPTILVDDDGTVWMTYGSAATGIKQRQIDPANGKLFSSYCTCYDLATRPGLVANPIEGPSLIKHGNFYYLFVSIDYCCTHYTSPGAYKQAVGRSTGPHGPFVDESGTPMMNGGGTVLLQTDGKWGAPGGGTAYVDPTSGKTLLIFHAHNMAQDGTPYQWVKTLNWVNDWPVIGN
jgi:arabinan endo-1,5-alpha-L-arabinosidase